MKAFSGILIHNIKFVKLLSLGFASGITIWPFIFLRPSPELDVNINHERIHIRQQQETLLLGFFIIYLFEFIYYRLQFNRYTAYRKISFEKEAFEHEEDMNYLKTRKRFAWWSMSK